MSSTFNMPDGIYKPGINSKLYKFHNLCKFYLSALHAVRHRASAVVIELDFLKLSST